MKIRPGMRVRVPPLPAENFYQPTNKKTQSEIKRTYKGITPLITSEQTKAIEKTTGREKHLPVVAKTKADCKRPGG